MAGFYHPELAKRLLGEQSPIYRDLISGQGTAEGAAASVARLFDNISNSQRTVVDLLGMKQVSGVVAPDQRPLSREMAVYQDIRDMVLDPAAYRARRSDLFTGATSEQIKAQDELKSRLGHIYQTADLLLRQGKLKIEFIKPGPGATADTGIEEFRDPKTGKADWIIRVRIGDQYKNAEPVLLGNLVSHELQHVYDEYMMIQRHGFETAKLFWDFQEFEMRAFIAGGVFATAYWPQAEKAQQKQNFDHGSYEQFLRFRQARELELIKEEDPASYQASLAHVARNWILGFYDHQGGGIKNTELIAAKGGRDALDRELKTAPPCSIDTDLPCYKALLAMQKNRETAAVPDIQRAILANDKIIAMLREEKERGLALKVNSRETKVAVVPAPGGSNQ